MFSAYSSDNTEDCSDKHTEPGLKTQNNQVPAERRSMKLNSEIGQEKLQVRLTQFVKTHIPLKSRKDDLGGAI